MKIIFDNIVYSIQKAGGVSVVWENIIDAVLSSKLFDTSFLEYEGSENNICRKKQNLKSAVLLESRISFNIERYLNPFVKCKEPFIFHSSYYRTCGNKNAINVTTVHDFTYELYRKGLSKMLHCWQKYRAIRNSDAIVCITENTKRDLLHYLPDVDPNKVCVIYNGVSDAFYPLEKKPEVALGKYVVFIGWRVAYKNFKLTVDALSGTDIKLAIVGSPLTDEEITYLDEKLGGGNYESFVHISNEELNKLYNSAYCLAYPSEYEGFGIPILEAQKAGCPVIAFNGSSTPEVIGETPLLLNNASVSEMKEKLALLEDKDIRCTIIKSGMKNSQRFSWTKFGREYIELYEKLAKSL